MPIYEYRCSACGREHEALQKLSDPPLATCPACHKDTLTKLVSAAGFQLKGSGWYVTDFRNGSKAPAKKDDKSDAKSDAKSDVKPDAKPANAGASEAKPAESKSETSASAPASSGTDAGSD